MSAAGIRLNMDKFEHLQLRTRVSRFWKVSQILSYLLAFAGSVVAGVSMGYTVNKFKGFCPLYTVHANLSFHNDSSTVQREDHTVIQPGSGPFVFGGSDSRQWEAKSTCDFATFTPTAGAVYAFILAYFVAMCDRPEKVGGRSRSQNRMSGLFIPILLMSLLFTILMLVSSVRTTSGAQIFCDLVKRNLSISCSDAQFYPWDGFPLITTFHNFLLTSMISSWIGTASFLVSVILLVARCFSGVDYKIAASPQSTPVKMSPPVKRRLYASQTSEPGTTTAVVEPSSDGEVRRRRRRRGRDGRQPKSDGSPLIHSPSDDSLSSAPPSPPPSPIFDSPDHQPESISTPVDSSTPVKETGEAEAAQIVV